jgi:hypothetical protein
MAAISYVISVGGNLQTVTAGTNAPSSGSVEIRFDQTAGAITDAALCGRHAGGEKGRGAGPHPRA